MAERLYVSGFTSQTFGMWQNPTALRDFTPSRNNLAVSRTLLQVDENNRLNENNTFFMREWFVYELPDSSNSANNPAYAAGSLAAGNAASFGHFMNDFYIQYTVRDAWWENKWGPLSTYIGNQIVVWGQSLAFRVGYVINPPDTTWAFGFANLEQSRIPQWRIHPMLNLPELGPLSSNFIEEVILLRYQTQWSWDYADGRERSMADAPAGQDKAPIKTQQPPTWLASPAAKSCASLPTPPLNPSMAVSSTASLPDLLSD